MPQPDSGTLVVDAPTEHAVVEKDELVPRNVEAENLVSAQTRPGGGGQESNLGGLLPKRIQDPNRFSPLKTFTYNIQPEDASSPLAGLLLKIHSNLVSRGITNLSTLGKYSLANNQTWTGGQFLAPKPTTTVLTNIDEFWIAADEIDITKTFNATIKVSGTVVLVANKINVDTGAQLTWYPPSPFSINQFDWKNTNGTDIRANNGGNGAAGCGGTWSNSAPPADKAGHAGGNGANGLPGNPGPDAPSLIIFAKEINHLPIINLSGFRGGVGQDGGNGGNGGSGDKGEPAQTSWGFNSRGCGWGGNGGPGGNAGRGGTGGSGGAGGDVVVYCLQTTKDSLTAQPINISLQPGPGGNGGACGQPGQGGPGGPHGDRHGAGEIDDTNRNGSTGPTGHADQTPPSQLKGADGTFHGSLTFNVLTDTQFPVVTGGPAIVSFVPNSGKPGDSITMHAVNVPAGTGLSFGTIRLTPVSWTQSANSYTTVFKVPESAPGGFSPVTMVDGSGKAISIVPENFLVLPRLDRVRGEARFGAKLTLEGAGFLPNARVLIGGQAVTAVTTGTTQVSFTIPMPAGAFEQNAGSKSVAVINPGGYQSNACNVSFDHWLHLGFDPKRDGFQFDNTSATITGGNVSIDLDLFTQTFGHDDREVLAPDNPAAVLSDLLDPANCALGWIFFGIYKAFLGSAPGICNGMSAYALDHFFSGGPALYNLYPSFTGKVARDVMALQGRVLSLQALNSGIAAIEADTVSHDYFGSSAVFRQLEAAIRLLIGGNTPNNRRAFPLLSFIPRYDGITDTIDFFNRISEDHTILPYAIRYPGPSESFLARIYCCNNWDHNNNFVRLSIQKDYSFVTEQFNGVAGTEYNTDASYGPLQNNGSPVLQAAQGWGIAPMPMSIAFYDNVDMPTNVFAYLSPVTAMLDDGNGHIIGKTKGDLYSQIPFIAPSPFVKGMFRLANVDKVTVTLSGQAAGSYAAGLLDVKRGTCTGVLGVTTTKGKSDAVTFDVTSSRVAFTPGSDVSTIKLVSAAKTAEGMRSSVLTSSSLKAGATAELNISGDLLVTKGPIGGLKSVWAKLENVSKHSASQSLDLVTTEGTTLNWKDLAGKIK